MEHSAHNGEGRNAYKIVVRELKGTRHLGDLGIYNRVLLKLMLNK
jgi:hypothetical protein